MFTSSKILLTGFGPFPNMPINPCIEIVPSIQHWAQSQSFELCTSILDVTYEGAFDQVQKIVTEFGPHMIVHLGVSSRQDAIHLEQSAINCRNASIPDVQGRRCSNEAISIEYSVTARLRTTLDVPTLQRDLSQLGHPVAVSHDAGQYVCNSLYWQSLHHFEIPVLFVHIPNTTTEGHSSTIACIQNLLRLLV